MVGNTTIIPTPNVTDHEDAAKLVDRLRGIESNELLIAFAGPVGVQMQLVEDEIASELKQKGYNVVTVKVSDFIEDTFNNLADPDRERFHRKYGHSTAGDVKQDVYARIKRLQDIGNFLRENYEPAILAQKCISKIILDRAQRAKPQYDAYVKQLAASDDSPMDLIPFSLSIFKPEKTAYLINQLKNPAEVKLLRKVYSDLFYLIGVIENKRRRIDNLSTKLKVFHKSTNLSKAEELEERDKSQEEDYGQQLEKTLQLADYFVYKPALDRDEIRSQTSRFLSLTHNQNINTPTLDEFGMYVAFSSGIRSSCLSRQVGASILDAEGKVLATGFNDVPKYGGGLYDGSPGEADSRCFKYGDSECHNDKQKRDIFSRIENSLRSQNVVVEEIQLKDAFKSAGLKDLIEFSRAVHAEMSAIINLARTSNQIPQRGTLYVTTFPCHSCARHIVAAGLERVVYIEPYAKSLAQQLHNDSISIEGDAGKVAFSHFSGVAPRRYQAFFQARSERKNSDGTMKKEVDYNHGYPEYLESYREIEAKVLKHLDESGLSKH